MNPAARQSLTKAEALIARAHNGPADLQRRLVFPVSNRYCAASRFDFGDGLFKNPDGTLVPRINSDMVIRAALKARQAVSATLAEAALRRAERPFSSSRSQPSGDAQDALPPSSQRSERVA